MDIEDDDDLIGIPDQLTDEDGMLAEIGDGDNEPQTQEGDVIWRVANTELAVCLLSVGIPLRTDLNSYVHTKLKDGTDQWIFLFGAEDRDGVLKTGDLIHGFTEDMKWIKEHPDNPFTYAMCAVKNLYAFKQHMRRDVPFVGFRSPAGKSVMWVKDGSRKYRNCVTKGMVQV